MKCRDWTCLFWSNYLGPDYSQIVWLDYFGSKVLVEKEWRSKMIVVFCLVSDRVMASFTRVKGLDGE
jgi:hypothetical protein